MILKGTANRGVKLLGTEVGAWMADGINNDFQIVKKTGWLEFPGGSGGAIDVAEDVITITQSAATTMYVTAPISTVIGQEYSVSMNILEADSTANLRVSDDTAGGADRLGFITPSLGLGVFTKNFTATQTTHYVTLLTTNNDTTIKFKNEVEIRHAEVITGVELFTTANAASDPNGNEANSTAGFAAHGSAALTSVASPVDVGTYAISAESNTTPTVNAGVHVNLKTLPGGLLEDGGVYIVSFRARHNGTGGRWYVAIGTSLTPTAGDTLITYLENTDTTYLLYSTTFTWTTLINYLEFTENNGANDGGVYVDNLSIRRAIPDLSSVNMGLAMYGSLNKHVVNVNADTFSYSGFTNSDYALQPYNSNLDFGTGDFNFRFWIKSVISGGTNDYIFERYGGSGNLVAGQINTTGYLILGLSGGNVTDTTTTVNDNVWHFCVMQRVGTLGEIWVDGVRVATATNAVDIDGVTPPTTIGNNSSLGAAAESTEIALIDVDGLSLTAAQILNIYNKEKILFERDSVHQVVDLGLDLNIERPSAINETPGGIRSSIPSDDGTARESIFQRRQKTHSASSGPVEQKSVKYITNFLDTVNEGQAFSYDPYGTESAPCDPRFVWLESASYQPVRDGDTNWFTTSFSVLERN